MRSIYPLKNAIMTYEWGSRTALAELLGGPVPSKTPQAELWMGAHPKAPSMVDIKDRSIPLTEVISQDPGTLLGPAVADRFDGQLPYLFKVLAIDRPLSLQAHPSRVQAEKGFLRENARHIPLAAPHRNYRDANHKPECICALTEFWALCGFRPVSQTILLLETACSRSLASEIDLLKASGPDGLRLFFKSMLTMTDIRKKAAIEEAVAHAGDNEITRPIGQWILRLADTHPGDIGTLAPIFMNLTCLSPGEALFLPAGRLHTYLEGTGIELMANSDNVLRGGLTAKHMDVAELLAVLNFETNVIEPLEPRPVSPVETVYPTSAGEFALSRISLSEDDTVSHVRGSGARILLCVKGNAIITAAATGETIEMKKGESVFVAANAAGLTLAGTGDFYQAAVPL